MSEEKSILKNVKVKEDTLRKLNQLKIQLRAKTHDIAINQLIKSYYSRFKDKKEIESLKAQVKK